MRKVKIFLKKIFLYFKNPSTIVPTLSDGLNGIRNGEVSINNFDNYLEKFAKAGADSQKRIKNYNYSLQCEFQGRGTGCSQKFPPIYYDAHYNLILTALNKKFPIANIGFETDGKTAISVIQIQGVPGRKSHLEPLRWEKMLLTIACDWAKTRGVKKIEVIPSSKNEWKNEPCAKRLYLKYDVTAKRCGFKLNQQTNKYVKFLN